MRTKPIICELIRKGQHDAGAAEGRYQGWRRKLPDTIIVRNPFLCDPASGSVEQLTESTFSATVTAVHPPSRKTTAHEREPLEATDSPRK